MLPNLGRITVTASRTAEEVNLVYLPPAGGVYGLMGSWGLEAERGHPIAQIKDSPPRQKAKMSHWIYRQNLKAGLLIPGAHKRSPRHDVMHVGLSDAELAQLAPGLDYDTVMADYGRILSVQDRRLNLLQRTSACPQTRPTWKECAQITRASAQPRRLGQGIQKRKNSGSTWRKRDEFRGFQGFQTASSSASCLNLAGCCKTFAPSAPWTRACGWKSNCESVGRASGCSLPCGLISL